jgi:peptidoglycan glycosyltransferase
VANGGRLMKPHIVDRVVDRDGRTVDKVQPQQQSRVMSASSAQKVNQMMQNVVREGTGTAAALTGIDVAGKTGTAQTTKDRPPFAWFTAFAPANDPQIAVAVIIEDAAGVARDDIAGGKLAAPVAKKMMEAVLGR